MLAMRYGKNFIYIVFVIVLLVVACDTEPHTATITMNDGNEITIRNLSVTYYSSESQFEQSSFATGELPIQVGSKEVINYKEGESYTISKVTQTFNARWRIVRFGEWASKYGLKSNRKYYVSTKVYTLNVVTPPSGLMICPKFYKENMGYPSMGGDIKTFDVIRSEADPSVTTFITYTKFVGYDDNKNRVDISIPQIKDTIKWRFLIQADVWG